MRVIKGCFVAVPVAVLLSVAVTAQDADKKVANGGVSVKGWTGKADPGNKQGLTVNDSKLASEGASMHLTTGPAAVYWSPANAAKGDYTVKATFKEPKQTINHPHPFGVFVGGKDLETDTPTFVYCVAYRDGTFTVRQYAAGKPAQIVRKTPNEKVVKAAGPDAEVTQEVAMSVKGSKIDCTINGASVWSAEKTEIPGGFADGLTGIRVSHNSDAIVSGFAVTK
jgi:hypothetical protein